MKFRKTPFETPTERHDRVRVRIYNRGRLFETHYVETFEAAFLAFTTSPAPAGTALIDGGTCHLIDGDVWDFTVYENGPSLKVEDMAARSNARRPLVGVA